ncbi:hypothetical protein ABPG72_016682 [Tetrahymena utriculariae]
MSKKNNFNNKKNQGGYNSSKGKANNETDFLYREEGDDTPFMSFTFEDFPNFEIDNEDDIELLFILKRICASYKYVLTLDFRSFWSTLRHNLLLRRSINSFLQYSSKRRFNEYYRKGHERKDIENSESEVKIILKEITRLVLVIIYRIVSCEEENLQKATEFGCSKIILDEWLIDIPKMIDLIAVYGEKNGKIVKEIIKKSFELQKEFKADFEDMQDKILKEYLDQFYKEMLLLKKKDKLGSASYEIVDSDIERKVELLCSILDTISSIIDILNFFPAFEVESIYQDEKINIMLENILYELIFAREEAWVMGKYRGDIILLIDVVLERIVQFFVMFFEFMIKVFGDKNLVKQNIGKKITSMWNKYMKDLGKVQSFGKKQVENRYWYLIEYVSDKVDFSKLFEVAPADNSEAYQLFQIQVLSVVDERKRNIIAYEEKKKEFEQKGDYEKQQQQVIEEIPDIKFVETIVKEDIIKQEEKQRRAEEFQKKKEEEERLLKEQQEKEEEIKRLEEKQEQLTMYQKGAQKVNLKMTEEQQKNYIQKSIWLAMEYDDEPDDSYNSFQPVVQGGNNNTEGEEENGEAESEEEDENGIKKKKVVEEGYDDGKKINRGNFGYQPKKKPTHPNKTNHYEAKQKYKSQYYQKSNNNQDNFQRQQYNQKPDNNQQNQLENNNSSSNNNPNQNQRKNNYQNNNNNNNNNNSQNYNKNSNYNNNYNQNQQKGGYYKKKQRNEEGYSGSEDESAPQQQYQQSRNQQFRNNNNKDGNFNKEGGYKGKKDGGQPQKNILKKKQFD